MSPGCKALHTNCCMSFKTNQKGMGIGEGEKTEETQSRPSLQVMTLALWLRFPISQGFISFTKEG